MFGADGTPDINRPMLAAKADEIDGRIKELKAMSKGLKHAAVCRAENHFACPTFQRLLRAAARGAIAPIKSAKSAHRVEPNGSIRRSRKTVDA